MLLTPKVILPSQVLIQPTATWGCCDLLDQHYRH